MISGRKNVSWKKKKKSLSTFPPLLLVLFLLIPRVPLLCQTKAECLYSLVPTAFPLLYKSIYHSPVCFISKHNI